MRIVEHRFVQRGEETFEFVLPAHGGYVSKRRLPARTVAIHPFETRVAAGAGGLGRGRAEDRAFLLARGLLARRARSGRSSSRNARVPLLFPGTGPQRRAMAVLKISPFSRVLHRHLAEY